MNDLSRLQNRPTTVYENLQRFCKSDLKSKLYRCNILFKDNKLKQRNEDKMHAFIDPKTIKYYINDRMTNKIENYMKKTKVFKKPNTNKKNFYEINKQNLNKLDQKAR